MSEWEEGPILTLEPLIDAVRSAVEQEGWVLSGLQKTTSHQFEGRWDGDSTRSAYLFFHGPNEDDPVSIDVYLDETSRGLTGNLALVVDLVRLGELGDTADLLKGLAALSSSAMPAEYPAPITLRFRLAGATENPAAADSEVRFKMRIPRSKIASGSPAVRGACSQAVRAFETIRASAALEALLDNG